MADSSISGTLGAALAELQFDTGENTTVAATVTVPSAFTGTITFQVLYDTLEGWVTAACFTRAGAGATSTLTAAGSRFINVTGALSVRAKMTAYTSGAVVATLAGSPAIGAGASSGGGGGAATIADGADVAEGTTTDVGIITDIGGTQIGFQRGNIKMWLNFLARIPAALVGGRLDVNVGAGTVTANQGTQNAAGTASWNMQGAGAAGASVVGNPVIEGLCAIALGTDPTAVAAGQAVCAIANRHGVPYTIGGHPNVISVRANYAAAQTDTALVTVAGGSRAVVTGFLLTASNANTVNVSAVFGLGTTNTPTTTGVLGAHPGIAPGSGFGRGGGSGIVGFGADGEDLRITMSAPTGGSVDVSCTYFLLPA